MPILKDRLAVIRQAIENGALTVKEIVEQTSLNPQTVYRYSKKHSIKIPLPPEVKDPVGYQMKRTSERDELIQQGVEQGLMLRELGASIGVSLEGARLYLIGMGKHEEWKDKRNQPKLEREKEKKFVQQEVATKAQFLSVLKERLYQKVEPEGWAMQKTVEAFYARDRREWSNYSLANILPIFQKYESAQKEGKKLSLVELAEGTPFSFVNLGKILSEIGVEPMHGAHKTHTITPPWKGEAINRAYEKAPLPAADIAHFLEIPEYIVTQRFVAKGKRHAVPRYIRRFGFGGGVLNYRLASQIYQAADLGFSDTEVTELFDTTPKVVEYALTERKGLESKIVNALQVLYLEEKITKPYRN